MRGLRVGKYDGGALSDGLAAAKPTSKLIYMYIVDYSILETLMKKKTLQ
jgi:hypothetical protein